VKGFTTSTRSDWNHLEVHDEIEGVPLEALSGVRLQVVRDIIPEANEKGMQLFVKNLNGKTLTIVCHQDWDINHLKKEIYFLTGIPDHRQRLIFSGKQLSDGKLHDYNIQTESTIHLLLKLAGAMYVTSSGRLDYVSFKQACDPTANINGNEDEIVDLRTLQVTCYNEGRETRVFHLRGHPKCLFSSVVQTIRQELNPEHFNSLSLSELEKIDSSHLSEEALRRLLTALQKKSISKNERHKRQRDWNQITPKKKTSRKVLSDDESSRPVEANVLDMMLQEEIDMRKSDIWQSRFREAEACPSRDWISEVDTLQNEVAERWSSKTGLSKERLLRAMRVQESDHVFPFWRYYNRARSGYLVLGEKTPDCELAVVKPEGCEESDSTLHSLISSGSPKVVLVSSSLS